MLDFFSSESQYLREHDGEDDRDGDVPGQELRTLAGHLGLPVVDHRGAGLVQGAHECLGEREED